MNAVVSENVMEFCCRCYYYYLLLFQHVFAHSFATTSGLLNQNQKGIQAFSKQVSNAKTKSLKSKPTTKTAMAIKKSKKRKQTTDTHSLQIIEERKMKTRARDTKPKSINRLCRRLVWLPLLHKHTPTHTLIKTAQQA